MGEIKTITNISIYGQTYFYDEKKKLVGFPEWYNKDTLILDYRVGHQFWLPEYQARAIVRRVLEQEWAKAEDKEY